MAPDSPENGRDIVISNNWGSLFGGSYNEDYVKYLGVHKGTPILGNFNILAIA